MPRTRGIVFIGRLQPVTLPGGDELTFITVYDFPDGKRRRLRLSVGDSGFVFDLPESEVRRFEAVAADWLQED